MYRNMEALEGVSFRRILEASLNEIYLFEPETLRFLFLNRGALLNLGYAPDEVARLTPVDLKPDFTAERFQALIAPLLSGEQESIVFETVHRRKDTTLYEVEVHLQLIRQPPSTFFLAIILDITERKRLEREREAAVLAAKSAAQSKTRFLAHMSHEIRTPLNVVIGYAEALALGLGRSNPAKIAEALGIIAQAGRQLDDLIAHILEFAREESDDTELTLEPILLSELLAELNVIFQPLARQHQVSYRVTVAAERTVLADRARLKSALLNLFSNAAKYGRVGGRTDVTVSSTATGARVCVRDNGIGMSPAFQTILFTPFSREGRTSTDVRGAGIGLTIARANVERMGGVLGFTSTLDQGSSFWIDLPAA